VSGRNDEKKLIGWREWVAIPDLGVHQIKAKVDTGAKTSALHAEDIRIVKKSGKRFVRFRIHPYQRNSQLEVEARVALIEKRQIRSSSGHETLRPVIVVPVLIAGSMVDIEISLVNRDMMGFRMLLGREALRGRFIVDPQRSFVLGRRLKES
jgi:hypothetical protein